MSGAQTTAGELSRAAGHGRAAAPVRLVHLGLGNFFRAHQAWYTDRAPDADDWGIAAFTGRRAELADALNAQEGLYTLVTRAADGDRFDVLSSLSRTHPAADYEAWLGYLASPDVRAVTITVTEAGYVRGADGALDRDRPEVKADVEALRHDLTAQVRTAPARLVAGCAARRQRRGGAAHRGLLRQPARQRCRGRPGGPRPGRDGRPRPCRLARRVGLLRHHHGRPDHAENHPGGSPHGQGGHRPGRPRPGRHRAVQRVGAQRRVPRRSATLGGRGRHLHRRHPTVRAAQALAAQRRPLVAGLRRVRPRPPDSGRGGRRRDLPGLAGGLVVGGVPAPEPARSRHRGLPRRPPGPVRQPKDAPPAGPDRRRRLPEAADPHPADPAPGAGRRPAARGRDPRARRLGVPPAR